jgi:hypothetical protein
MSDDDSPYPRLHSATAIWRVTLRWQADHCSIVALLACLNIDPHEEDVIA